jgi:hypothetical protein
MRFIPGNDCRELSTRAIAEIEPKLHAVSNNELKALVKTVVPEYSPFLD